MTELTYQLAATDDRWFREPAVAKACLEAFFETAHPIVADALE